MKTVWKMTKVSLSNKNINAILIKQAFRSLKRGSLVEAVGCLEKVASSSIQNGPYVDYLLSIAYLKSDKLAQASDVVRNSLRKYPDYAPFKEILTYLAIKSGSSKEEVIVPIIEYEQNYPASRKISKLHKKLLQTKNFSLFQRKLTLNQCLTIETPPRKLSSIQSKNYRRYTNHFNYKIIFAIFIFATMCFGIFAVINSYYMVADNSEPSELKQYRLDNHRYPLVDTASDTSQYNYAGDKELLGDYEKSRDYIKAKQYNQALYILNRILLSNVNISVKDRVSFLKDFIRRTDDKEYEEIQLKLLQQQSDLHNGFYIILTGKVTNLKQATKSMAFSLLVNEKNNKFDGIAQIISDINMVGLTNGAIVVIKGEFLKKGNSEEIIIKSDFIEIQ